MTNIITEPSIYYHKKRLKDFWKRFSFDRRHYRSITWWMACMNMKGMKASTDAKNLIKDLIRIAVIDKKISIEEATSLWTMIKSKDQDDWYIALNALHHHYPRAFVK